MRQEADGIRRYCHLATGNYNMRTSGVYGDLGLFTAHDEIGADVTELFNMLTGYTRPRALRHLILAPAGLRDGLVARIRREAEHARTRGAGRIVAKMNSLADRALIDELYRASQAGVRIDLIVRGICCLRPGVPGLSDGIRVISIVDRYLEHARMFVFDNAGEPDTCSPHPTGCRETSTIASRPPSPSSIAGSRAASATSSTRSSRTP